MARKNIKKTENAPTDEKENKEPRYVEEKLEKDTQDIKEPTEIRPPVCFVLADLPRMFNPLLLSLSFTLGSRI